MKLKGLFFLGLIFSAGLLNAQPNFKAGYIIKLSGDTLFGQIDYRNDLMMSSSCRFKDYDDNIRVYSPDEIAEFRFIDGRYYVSRVIDDKKVFLEFLIKGEVNIFYMRNEAGDNYYINKADKELTELVYEERIIYSANIPRLYQSRHHVNILHDFMQNTPDLHPRILSMQKPDRQILIELAEDYHNLVCEDEECIIYHTDLPSVIISFSPFMGTTKYNGYDRFISEIGGYLSLSIPGSGERLFFKTGLVYHKLSEGGRNLQVYKIPLLLQYSYRANRLQPNIGGGFNALILKSDNGERNLGHTLTASAGLDYRLLNNIYISTSFNSDFTPVFLIASGYYEGYSLILYSINVGLKFYL